MFCFFQFSAKIKISWSECQNIIIQIENGKTKQYAIDNCGSF